jgi:hypothetical protein
MLVCSSNEASRLLACAAGGRVGERARSFRGERNEGEGAGTDARPVSATTGWFSRISPARRSLTPLTAAYPAVSRSSGYCPVRFPVHSSEEVVRDRQEEVDEEGDEARRTHERRQKRRRQGGSASSSERQVDASG